MTYTGLLDYEPALMSGLKSLHFQEADCSCGHVHKCFCCFLTRFTFRSYTLAHVNNSLVGCFKEVCSERRGSDTASHFRLAVAVLNDLHLSQAVHEHHFIHPQSSGLTGHACTTRWPVSSKTCSIMRGCSYSSCLQTKGTVYYCWDQDSIISSYYRNISRHFYDTKYTGFVTDSKRVV